MDDLSVFERALNEYKEAIAHYEAFDELFNSIGISLCPNFYRKLGCDEYGVHVYEGLSKIVDLIGADVQKTEYKSGYKELWFNYSGLQFYQLDREEVK